MPTPIVEARKRPGSFVFRSVLATALLAGALAVPDPASAQKTDVVTLMNGDQITGEIKELELGKLRWSTDAAGTINIEWPEVAALQTGKFLEIQFASGLRLFGSGLRSRPDRLRHPFPPRAVSRLLRRPERVRPVRQSPAERDRRDGEHERLRPQFLDRVRLLASVGSSAAC